MASPWPPCASKHPTRVKVTVDVYVDLTTTQCKPKKCPTAIEKAPDHLRSASPIKEPYRRVATRSVKYCGNYGLIMLSHRRSESLCTKTGSSLVISHPLPSEKGLVSANTILVRCHTAPVLLPGDRFIENNKSRCETRKRSQARCKWQAEDGRGASAGRQGGV